MAIGKNYIAAKHTVKYDEANLLLVGRVTPVQPGTLRSVTRTTGESWFDDQLARYEGEIAVWREGGSEYATQTYVAIETSPGVLEWKRIWRSTGLVDPRTGLPHDPLSGFYNVLAS